VRRFNKAQTTAGIRASGRKAGIFIFWNKKIDNFLGLKAGYPLLMTL
jgi:hypothetical protein